MAEVLNRVIEKAIRGSAPAQINVPRDYWTQVIDIDLPPIVRFERQGGGKEAIEKAAKLLSDSKFPVILSGAGVVIGDAIEDGDSFLENAMIKAKHGAKESKIYTIADDSGIEVDALDGRPGVYSARYGGTNLSDEDRVQLLLRELVDVPTEKRTCRYRVMLVLARPDGSEILSEGKCEGSIAHKPIGLNGFGYDPLFYIPSQKCTSAELDPKIKNSLSHRGQALNKFIKCWNNLP